MFYKLLFIFFMKIVHCSEKYGKDDEVKFLPDFNGTLNFRHYSGYLDSVNSSHIHYWFFESQRNPVNDPLVVWLNGGPGCSSILGALSENGPFTLTKEQKLILNPYSWNTQANMLYLESPPGVGFSYNDNNDFETGDNGTAEINYEAIKDFFQKFPQYSNNDFYIAGESYGGIYVPTLSKLVNDRAYPKNFIGFALGNALLDDQLNTDTQFYFFFHHGFIDAYTWSELLGYCCPDNSNMINERFCAISKSKNLKCVLFRYMIIRKISEMSLNLYNVYDSCERTISSKEFSFPILHPEILTRFVMFHKNRTLLHQAQSNKGNPPCLNFDYMVDWFTNKDIKSALHISQRASSWTPCSMIINENYKRQYSSMHDTIKHLIDSGRRVIIYNGDTDAMCNYFGDELFADNLGYKIQKDYRPWIYEQQIGGMVKFYNNLTFATVRGAGHTAPTDKPAQCKYLFDNFIKYKGDLVNHL